METILQITSGQGPAECCWVVAQILKYIIEDARKSNVHYKIIQREPGIENGTLYSACIQFEGDNVVDFSNQWIGTIQWVGKSQFRKHHKRKNWFVGINKIVFSDKAISFDESDISFQAIRSGGPGGQHVNKVSTAIRAKHEPSGISVLVTESRSQLQNKKLATQRLLTLLKIEQLNQQKEKLKSDWKNHSELQRGNPVKTFYGSDFKSEFVDKKFKSKRSSLKNSLRKELTE